MHMLHSQLLRRVSFLSLLLAVSLLVFAGNAYAQERDHDLPRVSPSASVSQTIGVTEVTITYGRPGVRGRTIYGELVPYGEVWRTGADEATTITFTDDVELEGRHVEAGTYALFTIPDEDQWTILLNERPDQWGAYEYAEDLDVLSVNVEPETASPQEQLAFYFDEVDRTSATLFLHWDEVRVPVQLEVDTDAIISGRASSAIEDEDWDALHGYAAYALRHEVLMEEARAWLDEWTVEEETFANLALHARVLAWHGDYQQASDVVERALATGEASEASPRDLTALEDEAEEWH